MTVIAGMVRGRKAWLAGDSMLTDDGGSLLLSSAPKVWQQGSCLVGSAGELLWDQALLTLRFSSETWLRQESVSDLRQICKALDVDPTCGSALVATRGKLWRLSGDGLIPLAVHVDAIGSGGDVALGYLLGAQCHPATRVADACRAACRRSPGCGGRIVTVSL
jgi:hypothetical protein